MKNTIVLFSCFLIPVFFYACATTATAPSERLVGASAESGSDATLTWEAPTTNTDGSPLTDLAGYNVYYGPVSDKSAKMKIMHLHLDEVSCKDIDGGKEKKARTECTYTVEGLSPVPHYFKVTAFNITGQESDFSNEVKK